MAHAAVEPLFKSKMFHYYWSVEVTSNDARIKFSLSVIQGKQVQRAFEGWPSSRVKDIFDST